MVGKAAADTTLYVASSGAMVFASGTNQWSWGLALVEPNLLIQQITYNLLSDMGVQPKTPSLRLVLDGEIEKGDNRALTQFVDTGPDWILVANINRTLESLGLPLSMAIPEDASTKANDVLLVLEDSQKLPVISNITTVTSNSTVTINWDTNRPTYGRIWIQLASGTINYQLTTSRPGQLPVERVATDGSYMENHSIIVDNLLSNTEYFYHVASVDQQGNVSISSEQKFKTERGSIQAEVRNDLRNLYRSGRCWYLRYNNDRMVVYTVLSLGLFLGLIVYVLLRNRRPAK